MKWGKLTDDDLDVIVSNRDQVVGKIQERYGITKQEAEKELKSHYEPRQIEFGSPKQMAEMMKSSPIERIHGRC